MRSWVVVVAAVLGFGCQSRSEPFVLPTPGPPANPFWAAPEIGSARELGHVPAQIPAAERVSAGAITFVDRTDAAGLGSVVGGGNSHGVGIGLFDLNGDALPDLFVANGTQFAVDHFPSQLWWNSGDGTFSDGSAASGVAAILAGIDTYSVAGGDYDNDGDIDLYIAAQPTDFLLQNQGNGTFVDVTATSGAGGPPSNPELVSNGKSKIGAFGDPNRDGWLDIVVASSTLPAPGVYLLTGNGDGTFTDTTAAAELVIDGTGNPCAVMWTDYDNDSLQDLWIWNDRGGHVLLRNTNGVQFDNVTASALSVGIRHPMGIDGADIDHDGDLDYYIANNGNNPLLRNENDGTFNDITAYAGTGGEFSWGLAFEDFNHDTWPDIFVGQEDDLPYLVFTHLGEVPPRYDVAEVAAAPIVHSGYTHNVAVAFGDYDQDGRTDAVGATTDGSRITLFHNETDTGTNHWLEVAVTTPATGQAGAVSARVGVKTGDLIQFRDITGGSSRASQNEISVRFGLGDWDGAEWVVVLWPDGSQVAAVNVPANQRLMMPAN